MTDLDRLEDDDQAEVLSRREYLGAFGVLAISDLFDFDFDFFGPDPLVVEDSSEVVGDGIERINLGKNLVVELLDDNEVLIEALDLVSKDVFSQFDVTGGDSISTSNAGILHQFEIADGETLRIFKASLTLADGSPAPTDLDLDLIKLDGAGGGTFIKAVLTGDGSTVLVDVQNSDETNPIASYNNNSGSTEVVGVYVNNGDFGQVGTGSLQNAFAGISGEVG